MTDALERLRLGLVITTVGRPALSDLLATAAASATPPVVAAVANQAGRPLCLDTAQLPFPVVVVPSGGGASRGRNDAARAVADRCDVLGFPNDDSYYDQDVFGPVLREFEGPRAPVAVACELAETSGARFVLPPPGEVLTRQSVWRAIEPSMFVRRDAFVSVGGFRCDIGTGAPSPWGSGEGTDLLLRLMARGGAVVSRSDLAVQGVGERRHLDDGQLVAKHRAYARGTGHLYRVHGYPMTAKAKTLAGPVLKATRHDPRLSLSLRLALARSTGRLEGLLARSLSRGSLGRPLRPDAGQQA